MTDTLPTDNRILVLGAGELGMAVLRGLVERRGRSDAPRVSVLLRPLSNGDAAAEASGQAGMLTALGIEVVRADIALASEDDLAAVFAAFPSVICCTGFVGGPGTQRKITAAVLKAGVERYVPWQFGVDYDVVGRGSGQEVWDEQLDVRDMLRAQSRTRWTIVSTGMFTSFLFEPSFGVVDLENGRVRALGDWDRRLTVTTAEDIGLIVAAIQAARPPLLDQVVFVAGDTISYRELADQVERVLGHPVERVLWSDDQLRGDLSAEPDDPLRRYRHAFARDEGVAWPKDLTFNAERGMAVVDVPTWLRSWRDGRLAGEVDATSGRVDDRTAVAIARAEDLVQTPSDDGTAMLTLAERYYGFWNNGAAALLASTVSPEFIDRTLPSGRVQGRSGLADAADAFLAAFPDGRVRVLQQVIAGDRIVSHLRVTGRFTGERQGSPGGGQRIDYLATDIMRVEAGLIVGNWHVEDHEALHRQLEVT